MQTHFPIFFHHHHHRHQRFLSHIGLAYAFLLKPLTAAYERALHLLQGHQADLWVGLRSFHLRNLLEKSMFTLWVSISFHLINSLSMLSSETSNYLSFLICCYAIQKSLVSIYRLFPRQFLQLIFQIQWFFDDDS